MTYWIKTLGCQMNISDSERIAAVLRKEGYSPAQNMKEADLIVVNMCSVRQSAVDRVWGLTKNIKNNKNLTILTGCILKKDKKKFSSYFDVILGIETLPHWPKILKGSFSAKELINSSGYLKVVPEHSKRFSAQVPIMTGCNNYCSYCVVPYTRGKETSRPAKDIICEIKNLAKRGCKEIWLLGQNVNSYSKMPFSDLLREVDKIEGDFWIRFTSSNPKDFSEDIVKAIKDSKKITEYLNLPAQSGDDKVLKRMNRPYQIRQYKKIAKRARKEIPDLTLSTDIIVGFPGETKDEFENTIKLFEEIEYDMAYISQYSPRPGTKASKLKDNVAKKEKTRREKALNEVLKKTALKRNKRYLGKKTAVLIERKKGKKSWLGKTRNYKTIKVESNKNLLGKFVKAEVIKALPWGLQGKMKSHSA